MEPDWEYIDSVISANWLRMSDGQLAKLLGIRKCHVKKRRLVDLKLVKDWKTPSAPKKEIIVILGPKIPRINYRERMEEVLEFMKGNYKGEDFNKWIYTDEGQFYFYMEMTRHNLPVFKCEYLCRRRNYGKSGSVGSRRSRDSNRDDI